MEALKEGEIEIGMKTATIEIGFKKEYSVKDIKAVQKFLTAMLNVKNREMLKIPITMPITQSVNSGYSKSIEN